MIISPPLDDLKSAARSAIMAHFAALSNARPSSLHVTDAFKAGQAAIVLAGGASAFLDEEAKLRGVAVADLAVSIAEQAGFAQRIELARVQLNVAIDAAADHATVARLLTACGIELPAFAV